MTIARLDRVFVFGAKLSFLIPHEWIESTPAGEDVYLYNAPGADSGWLRVSLITVKGSAVKARDHLAERAQRKSGKLYEIGPNLVVAWERPSQEDGVPIYQYWWSVLRSVEPELSREALFSYTILRERKDYPENQSTVSTLSDLVGNAEFQPSVQVN